MEAPILRRLYHEMLRIRMVEEKIAALYPEQEMRTPHDAKGLLIASVEDNNPVVFIEHRWLYNITGDVPEGVYRVPLSWKSVGFSAEIVALVAEEALHVLRTPPRRVALPDCPTPTTPALAHQYYPRAVHIVETARRMMGYDPIDPVVLAAAPLDVPDLSFSGPF